MKHNLLIDHLNKYGKISEDEEKSIRKYFFQLETEKKQILIKEHSPCNKLFFVNSGFIRAYYTNDKGNEITRMFAWEGRFLTNIASFGNFAENTEIIETVKTAEILQINREDFVSLISSSSNLKSIYTDILEECNAFHIKRFEYLNTYDLNKKISYLKKDFPNLISELNDSLLSSFLGISRVHFANNKHLLYK